MSFFRTIFALLKRDKMNTESLHKTMSKRFFLKGDSARWSALNVLAINVKNGNCESESAIPSDKVLSVTFVDGFDSANPLSANNVSAENRALAYRKANHHRNYLLVCNGVFVGWATLHRKAREFRVEVATTVRTAFCITAKSREEAERIAREKLEESLAFVDIDDELYDTELDDTYAFAVES